MKLVQHYQDLRFLLVCDELVGEIPLQIPQEQMPHLPVEFTKHEPNQHTNDSTASLVYK